MPHWSIALRLIGAIDGIRLPCVRKSTSAPIKNWQRLQKKRCREPPRIRRNLRQPPINADMETNLPFPTDNIYKFFAVAGLLAVLAGFIGAVWITERANERYAQDYTELAVIKTASTPTPDQLARKPLLERKMEVTVTDRKAGVTASLTFGSIGLFAMLYGFRQWRMHVQPLIDETAKIQLAIARCQLAKATSDNLAAGRNNPAIPQGATTQAPGHSLTQPNLAAATQNLSGGRPDQVPSLDELLAAPTTSKWLASALASAVDRDPVDAANDADLLQRVMASRVGAMLEAHLKTSRPTFPQHKAATTLPNTTVEALRNEVVPELVSSAPAPSKIQNKQPYLGPTK